MGNLLYDQNPYENNWDGLNLKGNSDTEPTITFLQMN